MRRWMAIGGLLVVTSSTAAPTSVARGWAEGAVRTCTTSQLKIGLVGSFAGLGESGGYIGFTNRASTRCRLTGWPTLVVLTRAGASTATQHVRSTQFGPNPLMKGVPVVTLRHGERAEAVFVAGDNPGPGKTTCPPSYRYLRVTPPGNSHSVLLSAWLPYLDGYLPACTRVWVSMVVPRSDLHHG